MIWSTAAFNSPNLPIDFPPPCPNLFEPPPAPPKIVDAVLAIYPAITTEDEFFPH
jgi:hypothetical protein